MDADTSEKIRDVIGFVHSRTLSIGIYSPGDISVTSMYEEAASDLAEIIQQAIAKQSEMVNRLEVTDETGRVYVRGKIYGSPINVELSYQDGGKTLKVFVEPENNDTKDNIDE